MTRALPIAFILLLLIGCGENIKERPLTKGIIEGEGMKAKMEKQLSEEERELLEGFISRDQVEDVFDGSVTVGEAIKQQRAWKQKQEIRAAEEARRVEAELAEMLRLAIEEAKRMPAPGTCGNFSQPCCPGNQCTFGTCNFGLCQPCGNLFQPCCGTLCNAGSTCSGGLCQPCGNPFQLCCGTLCNAGSNCSGGFCQPCGNLSQFCCPGNQCTFGTCSFGLCQICGNLYQPCCGGTCTVGTCSGGLCKP